MRLGFVTTTAAGRHAAARLSGRWPEATSYDVREFAAAWRECDALVVFLAVGATVRLMAPLLADKRRDPGVVCVDEAGRYAVAVAGGHGGGANRLAREVGELLGAEPVVTTATDVVALPALDELGWPVEGDVAAVTRAMLDGEPVSLHADQTWPLPPLPVRTASPGEPPAPPCVLVTDRAVDPPQPAVVVRPPSLVVGVGASRGVPAPEVLDLLQRTLDEAKLAFGSVTALATVEAKAEEAGLVTAAAALRLPLRTCPASELAEVEVPHPSEVVRAAVGTASVAEAAALRMAGDGATLVVGKRRSQMATVAVARRQTRGRLAIVGLGPGARELLTPAALAELRRASVLVGLDSYVAQVRDLLPPGVRVEASGLGDEEHRAGLAVELARAGHAVALIGSGDAGMYAMASPALERYDGSFDVVGVPGITAMLAAAARLGAPLGHDTATISLSDLHTPWAVIEQRVRAAADGDFVVACYNPRSATRTWQLPKALAILADARPPDTPVGVVTDATRRGERVELTTLEEALSGGLVKRVGMTSLVLVGSSQSRIVGGRFVTPRGYRWSEPAEACR